MVQNFTKSLLVVLAALFSFSFAFAETGSETEMEQRNGNKNTTAEGQSYTIDGSYIAGTGSVSASPMTSKGLKFRTGTDGERLVFTVRDNYTITKLTITGVGNYDKKDASLDNFIDVTKVEVDGVETTFEGGNFPAKGASEAGLLTVSGISAKQSVAIYFDNSNAGGTQINASWVIEWERPDAAQPTITVSQKALSLVPGAMSTLSAHVDPAKFITEWFSDKTAVATVAEDGTVTAVAAGTANIINRWTEDAKVADTTVVTVADFNPANYAVAKKYDFISMGDVTLELAAEATGAIWNEANSKTNNVFFCTNEGLESIALQAAAPANGKGWSIVDGKGLYLGSGAGRCAAIGGLKTNQIVEIVYTGTGFYTGSKNDAVRKDDGAPKTALNEGVGRAIYKMDEDGMLGFELIKGNAVKSVTVYDGEASTLRKEAVTLAADADAVAVGKLLDAINVAEVTGDESGLQAAIDEFKANNKDQEKDETAKVATNGWKKFTGNDAAGVCATQFAPAITTFDGRNAQLAENYETTTATTGQIIYQTISGLTNGKYKVGFYGNAFYTSGRGFESDMADGAGDVAYVFANDQKAFITAHIATSTTENDFRQFDVNVVDGTITLGMGKEKAGTNWHTMQIYQLTWFTTAKEVYASLKTEMATAIDAAKALAADENKAEGKDSLNAAITTAGAVLASNKVNITEMEAAIAALENAVKAFKKANYFAFNGVYYVQATNGKYMAAGHEWGTRGIVNESGLDLTLASDDNNTVSFDSQVSNGGEQHYMGTDLYMDGQKSGWYIEKAGADTYTISNGTQYIGIDENDNLILTDSATNWKFIKAEDMLANRLNALKSADKENGVDATFLLQNPNFNRNDQRVSAWNVSEDCTNKNLNGGNNINNCAESYHSTFTVSQIIKNAPKGLYKLTAQGFYRQDNDTTESAPVFFIGDQTAEISAKTGSEGNMSDASASFTNGDYTIEPIEYILNADTMVVGVRNETAKNQWVIFDNFQLTYYGNPSATTTAFNFNDSNFRENIGETMTDTKGFIYNETFTADNISLQITGGSAPSRIYVDKNRGQNLVTYKDYATLTFRAPEGKAITKIEFIAAGNSNINNFTYSSGNIEGMIWTGNANGVRFTQGGTSYLANAIVTLVDKDNATAELQAIQYTECANIAAFNALEAGTYAKVTLKDAEVIGISADGYSTAWVQDATGGCWLQYTSLQAGMKEMTKGNGFVYVVKRETSGNPQMKETEDTPKSVIEGTQIEAYTMAEGTIAEVNVAANLNKVVKIAADSLVMTSATAGILYVGETTIAVANGTETANQQLHKIAEWTKDSIVKNVTVVAILVAKSTSENQLLPISMEETNETVEPIVFAFSDPNFRENIGESMTDEKGWIYNETFTAEGISLQITAGSAQSRIYVDKNRGQNLVTYKEYATLTFRAPEGKAITKIEFTAAGNSNINNFTASSGAIEGMTWTGNANGVRFTQGGTSYLANAIVTLVDKDNETAELKAIEYTECANIAAFNALEAGTYAKVTLKDAEVIGISADGYSTAWVQDATGGCWLQYNSLIQGMKEMTKGNGFVYVVKRTASGNPQMKEAEDTPKSEIAGEQISEYTVIEGTIAKVNKAENLNRVVKIKGGSFVATSATAGTLTVGEESITVNNGNATANQMLNKIKDEWVKDVTKMENVTIVAILSAASATKNQLLPISMVSEEIEGISTVCVDNMTESIYNLQGQRRNHVQKGLNIVNGKKFVIK